MKKLAKWMTGWNGLRIALGTNVLATLLNGTLAVTNIMRGFSFGAALAGFMAGCSLVMCVFVLRSVEVRRMTDDLLAKSAELDDLLKNLRELPPGAMVTVMEVRAHGPTKH
jgi:hypothetical protein